jgi:hypothetical protein
MEGQEGMYLKDGRARRYVPQGWKGKKVCTSRMEGPPVVLRLKTPSLEALR